MPTYGEKAVRNTEEGHRRLLNMQVAVVKRRLTSDSRICDAGRLVNFTKDGGTMKHLGMGQETRFHRVGNVYRLKARVHGSDSGFSRPGCF